MKRLGRAVFFGRNMPGRKFLLLLLLHKYSLIFTVPKKPMFKARIMGLEYEGDNEDCPYLYFIFFYRYIKRLRDRHWDIKGYKGTGEKG